MNDKDKEYIDRSVSQKRSTQINDNSSQNALKSMADGMNLS